MLNLRKHSRGYEEVFTRFYEQMFDWSLQLTGGDRAAAEDLLHDVYVLLALSRADFDAVENVEGYLYRTLRNLRISYARRDARINLQQLTMVDYDSAADGLRTADGHRLLQAQDELRRVCQFACARKEKAKAASVLILRFFHGYYPSEIALILKTSREGVNVRLLTARSEAKLDLRNPKALAFIGAPPLEPQAPASTEQPSDDFLTSLGRMIFRARRGGCLPTRELRKLYEAGNAAPVNCVLLAHIVSCPVCLETVNDIFGLPSLRERYPTDTLVREDHRKNGRTGGGSGGGTPGGGPGAEQCRRLRRRAGAAFEHQPQELCVSVNGDIQGAQRVNSAHSELTLVLGQGGPVHFVEVFSEQHVRLLLVPVDSETAAAEGAVTLSNGRTLSLKLEPSAPQRTLHLAYHDPTYQDTARLIRETAEQDRLEFEAHERDRAEDPAAVRRAVLWAMVAGYIARALKVLFGARLWLRPGAYAALLSVVIVGALLLLKLPTPTTSAAELLRRAVAAAADDAAESQQVGTVLRRTVELEEREPAAGGRPLARRKIEVWQSPGAGVTARRLYDEQGRLLAGEWREASGARTLYYNRAYSRPTPMADESAPLTLDDAWLYELSARDFTALVVRADAAQVKERDGDYLISYEGVGEKGIVGATLVLTRGEMRAVEQTLKVRQGNVEREFRFAEVNFERRPRQEVPPSVFEPNRELLNTVVLRRDAPGVAADGVPPAKTEASRPSDAAPSATATADLEVEVLRLLNEVGANLGEQISVTRTSAGQLRVQAVTDTERRKGEILRALKPVLDDPALSVEVITAAEAARRKAQGGRPPVPGVVEHVEPSENRIPAEEELRLYFMRKGLAEEQVGAEIRSFAFRSSSRAQRALQHAWALKRLAERFSGNEASAMSEESRAKWLSMIEEHAAAVRLEASSLRAELQPIFFEGSGPHGEGVSVPEGGLNGAADRLLQFCKSTDEAVSSALTVSNGPATAGALRSPRLPATLTATEALARWVQAEAQRLRAARAPAGAARASP